jgi:ABC-2 type transport system ATP-binding protein
MDSIILDDIRKSYGKFQALKGVSLSVPQGIIMGLLGPNGAGKSTLIRSMVGSVKTNSGMIEIMGMHPLKDKWKLRQEIGYMPQSPSLYEDLNTRDNIAFFGRAAGMRNLHDKIDEIVAFTELKGRDRDAVQTFSGGMKKRVSLACALIHSPKVLFLDEPTAAIDPHLKLRSWELFRKMASEGVTIIICTHLMDEALLCDKVAILREGTLLAEDTPENLLQRGKAIIKISEGGKQQEITCKSNPEAVAEQLKAYGLRAGVESVEIDYEDLESIVLKMINSGEGESK